jgi:hypothetical protein
MTTEVQNTPATQAPPSRPYQIKTPFNLPTDHVPPSYLIHGLIRTGKIASIGGKPKQGKSSLSRFMAVAITKGEPFLGRATKRGEVLLVSFEDDDTDINTSLQAIGWNPETDAAIRWVTELPRAGLVGRLDMIRSMLTDYPDTTLLVIDTLAKFGYAEDGNSFGDWLKVFEPIRDMLKDFPQVSTLVTLHCKKVIPEDVFDSILGSTGIRAEFETNMAMFEDGGKRFFTAEVRLGRKVEPTELLTTLEEVELYGSVPDEHGTLMATVPTHFALGSSKAVLDSAAKAKEDSAKQQDHEGDVINVLRSSSDGVLYQTAIPAAGGNRTNVISAIDKLTAEGVIKTTGAKKSKRNPYTLHLNPERLSVWEFTHQYGGQDVN